MKNWWLLIALAISGCAVLSEEEIAGCKGSELCINGLLEDKKHEAEDRRIVRYEKALTRYLYLQNNCPAGGVMIKCDYISKGCGRPSRRKTALLSVWELESAGCTSNAIW